MGIELVKLFLAMVLWELLGELGLEFGALLYTDDIMGEMVVIWVCLELFFNFEVFRIGIGGEFYF